MDTVEIAPDPPLRYKAINRLEIVKKVRGSHPPLAHASESSDTDLRPGSYVKLVRSIFRTNV